MSALLHRTTDTSPGTEIAVLPDIEDWGIDAAAEMVYCRDAGQVERVHDAAEDDEVAAAICEAEVGLRETFDPTAAERFDRIIRRLEEAQSHDHEGDCARTRADCHLGSAHADVKRYQQRRRGGESPASRAACTAPLGRADAERRREVLQSPR